MVVHLLVAARILVVALRDLPVLAVPLDAVHRSISVRLMSIGALVLAGPILGVGVVDWGRQARMGSARVKVLRFRRVRVPLVP